MGATVKNKKKLSVASTSPVSNEVRMETPNVLEFQEIKRLSYWKEGKDIMAIYK